MHFDTAAETRAELARRTITPELAIAAANFYRQRQHNAAEIVRNRGMSQTQAQSLLRPWLALACLTGADLPEFQEAIADRRFKVMEHFPRNPSGRTETGGMEPKANISPVDTSAAGGLSDSFGLTDSEARWLVATEICPRPAMLKALADARDEAWDKLPDQGDPNSDPFLRASHLNRLADALGCKPYLRGCTAAQRKAA
jgi:hypothetical protein